MGLFSNLALNKNDEEISEILKNINIFNGLSTYERARISKYFLQKEYEPHAVIVKESTPGDGMFVIKSGAVKITKKLTEANSEVLANLVDGDFFGEMALLDGSPRSASVTAVSKVIMLELYRASLEELLDKEPKIGIKVLKNLAIILVERIRNAGDKIRDILVWQSLKKG